MNLHEPPENNENFVTFLSGFIAFAEAEELLLRSFEKIEKCRPPNHQTTEKVEIWHSSLLLRLSPRLCNDISNFHATLSLNSPFMEIFLGSKHLLEYS